MRLVLIAAAALIATPALAQQDRPPAYTNAEACLRENASAAVRASGGAADAAEFLIEYLCAGPVSAAAAYEANSATLAAMRAMMDGYGLSAYEAVADTIEDPSEDPTEDEIAASILPNYDAMFDAISVDPTTGAFVSAPGSTGSAMIGALGMQGGSLTGGADTPPPIFLRELAGRLVLEHRR